jgi:hypothetical protein
MSQGTGIAATTNRAAAATVPRRPAVLIEFDGKFVILL